MLQRASQDRPMPASFDASKDPVRTSPTSQMPISHASSDPERNVTNMTWQNLLPWNWPPWSARDRPRSEPGALRASAPPIAFGPFLWGGNQSASQGGQQQQPQQPEQPQESQMSGDSPGGPSGGDAPQSSDTPQHPLEA